MSNQIKKCLYCQGDNNEVDAQCRHCGMALPQKHPNDRSTKVKFFVKAFWAIVIFCVVMIFYLPR